MGQKPFDVVVVGELNPDLILSGDVRPDFGQVEKLVDGAKLVLGSSSAIFARGAARLGLKVAFIGRVGDDLFGDFACKELNEYGIETSGIVRDQVNASGISVILSNGADRAILTYPGTIPFLEYPDIDLEIIQQARHLHVGSYYIQDGLRPDLPRLFTLAHAHHLTTSLDTNYDPAGKWDAGIQQVLTQVDIFLPNSIECLGISGMTDLDHAAAKLAKRVKLLGVKLGKEGAWLFRGEETYRQTALPINVVDTVGAGDSFDAGFIYGYLSGWELRRVLQLATICGSLSTRQAGGTRAQPTLDEALQYM